MAAAMATARGCVPAEISFDYDSFTKKCENYVSASEETAGNIKSFLKALYGAVKETEAVEGVPSGATLPELIVDNFDEEQIWQELELQNEARVDSLVGNVARLVAQKDKFTEDTFLPVTNKSNNELEESIGSGEGEDEDDDDALDGFEEASDNAEFSMSESSEDDDKIEEDDEDDSEDDGGTKMKLKKKSKISEDTRRARRNGKPSVVDDKFFKLSEMEEFLEREEQENYSGGDDSSDESIDLFNEYPSDEDEDEDDVEGDDGDSELDKSKLHYSDFFDAPDQESQQEDGKASKANRAHAEKKKKAVKFDIGGNDSDQDEDLEPDEASDSDESHTSDLQVPGKSDKKSTYEMRQEKLQAKIKRLEEEAISEKPWQLKGEISTEHRPENALLEEALEFDLTHRPAPVVTEETTKRLEDIIKQRIKDKAWDDVERKQKPVEAPTEFKKKLVLDQEKSKISLAQVYEKEYLKQVEATNPESDKPEEVPKEHIEIKTLVDSLFRKLDALSNFHFTPKQVGAEVRIVTNIPAITMEEVAPLATSDATLLAPEEVKAKPKGDVKSQGEKTATDRKRDRRQKKQHQKLVSKEREKREAAVSKLKPGLGNKYSKEKAIKLLEKVSKDSNVSLIDSRAGQSMKSSTAFFNQLQEEVTSNIKSKTINSKKRKNDTNTMSAKRLKL